MKRDLLVIGLVCGTTGLVMGVGAYAVVMALVWADEKLRSTERESDYGD